MVVITDAEVVERILDGRLNPADAISRSCEILEQYQRAPASGRQRVLAQPQRGEARPLLLANQECPH